MRFFSFARNCFVIAALASGLVSQPAFASDGERKTESKKGDLIEGSTFLPLTAFSVTVLRRFRVRGILSVSVELEVYNFSERRRIRKLRPRLRSAYNFALKHYANTRLNPKRPLKLRVLETLLQQETDKVLGDNIAGVMVANAALRKP